MNFKNKFWRKRSVSITDEDPTFKGVYLGNVVATLAKGDETVEKPLALLWKNFSKSNKPAVGMKLTACNSGFNAVTKEHGLTEYWFNRLTYCTAHPKYPGVFCWIYRHEGKKLQPELRCHAVFCKKTETASKLAVSLRTKMNLALLEFKREKLSTGKARLSLANSLYDNPSPPKRKILLSTGTANYRQPSEQSKSAPRLMSIDEDEEVLEEIQEKIVQLVILDNENENQEEVLSYVSSENEINEDSADDEIYALNYEKRDIYGGENDEDLDMDSITSEPSGDKEKIKSQESDIRSLSSTGSSRTHSTLSSSSVEEDDADSSEEYFAMASKHINQDSHEMPNINDSSSKKIINFKS